MHSAVEVEDDFADAAIQLKMSKPGTTLSTSKLGDLRRAEEAVNGCAGGLQMRNG